MSKPLNQIKAYARNKGLPVIPISAKNVSIITEPYLFYETVHSYIRKSRNRLALSALYLGTGSKERAIVEAICENLRLNEKLSVNVVLDAHRATRLDEDGDSSISLLKKALKYNNVELNLVDPRKNNTFLSGFFSNIQKWNEISSTYHSKILVSDEDILITGANLSSVYFERRQDRYMQIKNSKILSDYVFDLLSRVNQKHHMLKDAMNGLNQEYIKRLAEYENIDTDSFIIPLTQHGLSGITEKEEFLSFLDSILPKHAQVHMSTGYFNPSSTISSLKIDSVLAPSETANGFFDGRGLLKYIPRIYAAIQKRYIDNHEESKMFLYERPDWSFHAKGIWVEGFGDLYVHLIGSSNFNCRSSSRDFETQLVLLTRDKELIKNLKDERLALWKGSSQVDSCDIKGLNLIYNTLANIIKTFL